MKRCISCKYFCCWESFHHRTSVYEASGGDGLLHLTLHHTSEFRLLHSPAFWDESKQRTTQTQDGKVREIDFPLSIPGRLDFFPIFQPPPPPFCLFPFLLLRNIRHSYRRTRLQPGGPNNTLSRLTNGASEVHVCGGGGGG